MITKKGNRRTTSFYEATLNNSLTKTRKCFVLCDFIKNCKGQAGLLNTKEFVETTISN